jgi:hypothetical protein
MRPPSCGFVCGQRIATGHPAPRVLRGRNRGWRCRQRPRLDSPCADPHWFTNGATSGWARFTPESSRQTRALSRHPDGTVKRAKGFVNPFLLFYRRHAVEEVGCFLGAAEFGHAVQRHDRSRKLLLRAVHQHDGALRETDLVLADLALCQRLPVFGSPQRTAWRLPRTGSQTSHQNGSSASCGNSLGSSVHRARSSALRIEEMVFRRAW